MTRCQYKGLTFESPPGWVDKTILALVAPSSDPESPGANLIVTRETRRAGESVATYAHRQIVQLAARLPQFEMLESSDSQVDGRSATRSRFRWKSAKGTLVQAMAHVESPEHGNGVLILTCTSSGKEADLPPWTLLEHMLSTARWEKSMPNEATPPPSSPASSRKSFFTMDDIPCVPMPRASGATTRGLR